MLSFHCQQQSPVSLLLPLDETDHYVNMLSPRKTSPQTVEVDTQAAITNKEIQEDHIQPKDLEIQGEYSNNYHKPNKDNLVPSSLYSATK